jgi:LuxR family maltose regulon positive regulatory protein
MNRLVSQKAPWLAQTKFHVPQIRDDSIARQRLSAWLAESIASTPITLVSAPAGYGKTTLLATLQNSLDGERRIAWLSLDEEEDDLNAFLFALIGALQTLDPRCGAQVLDLLPLLVNRDYARMGDSPSDSRAEMRRLMGILINEIQGILGADFVLILDDLHFISNPLTLAALDYLLERMPGGMRIVMATRRDPPLSLPRYRARRRLAELRLTDLRFTVTETGDLLNEALGLDMAADAVETLQARTEGWAAGLSLLANSLERMPPGERALFIEQLARTHQETFDYLSDEVLRWQPDDVQTFLLQTSILHTLTPQQCTAVTGMPHTTGILEDLYRRNVFILAVDSEGHDGVASLITYRYHALFADFLRHRLLRELPDQAPELHRRAAAAQSRPARAIHHYAEAQMWDEAAAVIDAAGLETIRQGQLDPLSGWINLLPEATRLAHPRLAYLMGLCELQKGEPAAADRWLAEALDQARISGNSRIQGVALAALGSVNFVQLQFEQTLEFVSQALTYEVSPYVQVQALMARASVALFGGDWVGAAADLEQALQIVESTASQEALLALMLFLGQEFTLLPGSGP